MKILIVLTGGTIGSKVEDNTIDLSSTSPYKLINEYEKIYGNDTDFDVIQPLNILSENMTPESWTVLCKALSKIDTVKYDAVIITHGSDTLSYTSALVWHLYHDAPIPFILIASNYAIGEKESNGLQNLRSAVTFAKTAKLGGAYTIYSDENGNNNVYLASKITEADCCRDQFGCFGGKLFGTVQQDQFVKNANFQPDNAIMLKNKRIAFEQKVLLLRPYPGLNYDMIDLSEPPAAVLHYLYHSATACVTGGNSSVINFVRRCKSKSIPVYLASFKGVEKLYASCRELLQEKVTPLINISCESAYMKLLIAYNQREYIPEKYANS